MKTSTSSDQGPPRDEQAQSSSDVVHTRSHSDGGTKRHSSGGGASSQKKEFRERTGWTHRPMHIGNDGFGMLLRKQNTVELELGKFVSLRDAEGFINRCIS